MNALKWLLGFCILSSGGAFAATPIRVSPQTALSFGKFAATNSGIVTLSPLGIRTATAGIFLFATPTWDPAIFAITGQKSLAYGVTLPSTAILSNGTQTMTISNLTSSPAGSGVFSRTGTAQLNVGGTLAVQANQARGAYSGTFDVTINYQ